MVQTTTQAGAEKRTEILRQAAHLFRKKGFHETGMRDIARSLGIAPGALYYYFKSKEDLLFACHTIALTRLLEEAGAIVSRDEAADAKLRRLIRSHLVLTLGEMGGSAAHLEFHALPEERLREVVARRDEYEAILRGVIREGIEGGCFRPVDSKVATLTLFGALNWAVIWWRPEGEQNPEQLADKITDLVTKGLAS